MINQAKNTLQAHALDVLLQTSQIIGDSLATEETIKAILKLLSENLHLHRGRVILPDPDTGKLHIRFSEQLSEAERNRASYAIGEGVTGQVMATGQIALIPDVSSEPLYLARITNIERLHKQRLSYIAIPILQNNTPIGVLAAEADKAIQTDFQQELHVLKIIAAMIGQLARISGLANKQTQQLLKQQTETSEGIHKPGMVYGILGESTELQKSINMALKAADSDAAVLLEGESGSGKERFARMIHLAGPRRDQPFVCINCAAIPNNLLEAELFGYEKGSFTGATSSRPGKLELAENGTLFLDEIGDMSLDLQAKLLRVLQDKVVQRIGGQKESQVDIRIITATNQRLKDAVGQGSFRMDLYYRINVIRIKLPPLRARQSDIRLLASYFMIRENQRHGRNVVLGSGAMEALENYSWPGNVRQLENVIVRLVIMTEDQNITAREIETILAEDAHIDTPNVLNEAPLTDTDPARPYQRVNTDEHQAIVQALDDARGNKTAAARKLGLTPRQLYYRMRKLDIPLSSR
ncbi:sigma 54-interacting transcriptional regulator [Kaarinaea lacus]